MGYPKSSIYVLVNVVKCVLVCVCCVCVYVCVHARTRCLFVGRIPYWIGFNILKTSKTIQMESLIVILLV